MKSLKHILLFCCCLITISFIKAMPASANMDCYVINDRDCYDAQVKTIDTICINNPHNWSNVHSCRQAECGSNTEVEGWSNKSHSNVSSLPPSFRMCSYTPPPFVNGFCGSSHGGIFGNSTPPTTDLCNDGTATAVSTNPTTYTWSCNGSGGGTDASCSATRSPPSAGPCQIGVCGGVVTNTGCGGDIHVGASCSTGQPSLACPSGQRIFRHVPCGGGAYAYTCQVDASCSAPVNGTCPSPALAPSLTPPTSGLCATGNPQAPPVLNGTNYEWICEGSGGGSNSPTCQSPQMIHGSCGSADGTPTATQPTSNLCDAGTVNNQSTSSPWTWDCQGQNSGANVSCSAPTPAPPPSFGGACPL